MLFGDYNGLSMLVLCNLTLEKTHTFVRIVLEIGFVCSITFQNSMASSRYLKAVHGILPCQRIEAPGA